jgi:capsid protein
MTMRPEQPIRTIQLSAYYDAVATTTESDFGAFAPLMEDYYFAGPQRSIALGRLRRETRNNPYLAGLVNNFPSAIGTSNLRSRTSKKDYNDAKEKFWYRWKKKVTRVGDSLRTVEDILLREMLVAGEIFQVEMVTGQIQLIPSEFCGSPYGHGAKLNADGTKEINGILYDQLDRPTGYRFGKMTPSGGLSFAEGDTTVVLARYVKHVYAKDRVLMGRGLPWLLPSLRPAHDLYEITRSKTKQIKDANNISGTIESASPEGILEGMRGKPATIEGDTATAETEADAADKQDATPVVIQLKPGTFIALKPGEKLNMLKTAYQAQDYKELVMLVLHAISTPLGFPVELWFSGLGDVNYSGFKGLGTQWNGRRRYIIAFLEDSWLNDLHTWRITKATDEGDLPPNPDKDHDLIDWAWRRTAVLDEEKEAKSNQVKLQSGECSLAEIWEEKGLYAEEVFAQRRQLWIRLEIAAGNLKDGGDHSAVIVPREFLLRGALPGQNPYPMLPSGTGENEDAPVTGKPAKTKPAPQGDEDEGEEEKDDKAT